MLIGVQPMLINPFWKMLCECDISIEERSTYEVVVLAADGLLNAVRTASNADDRDGVAAQADKNIDVLEDNAQQAEESGDSGSGGL